VAEALHDVLVSPNVYDSNGEGAICVDALDSIRGAIKAHAMAVEAAGERIGDGLDSIASAINNLAEAVRKMRA
jgi:hypothetical protein